MLEGVPKFSDALRRANGNLTVHMLVPGIHVTALIKNVADVPHNHQIHLRLLTYICICYKKPYKYIKLMKNSKTAVDHMIHFTSLVFTVSSLLLTTHAILCLLWYGRTDIQYRNNYVHAAVNLWLTHRFSVLIQKGSLKYYLKYIWITTLSFCFFTVWPRMSRCVCSKSVNHL